MSIVIKLFTELHYVLFIKKIVSKLFKFVI